jgi:hypothetical protein
MDGFEHVVTRLPHLEHERRHRQLHEPGLRNRIIPPDPQYPVPSVYTPGPEPMPEALARPLERLSRAAMGVCIDCGGPLDYLDELRCLMCLTRYEQSEA